MHFGLRVPQRDKGLVGRCHGQALAISDNSLPDELQRIVQLTCFKMLALSSYAIVAEVAVDIADVAQGIVLCTEAEVAISVEPDGQGTDICHQYPEADVKLPALQTIKTSPGKQRMTRP